MKQNTKGRSRSALGGFVKTVGMLLVLGGIIYALVSSGKLEEWSTVTVDNGDASAEMATATPETVIKEPDLLDAAKADLDKINRQLDEEETRLVAEKEAIDARLNQINELRLSF